MVRPRGCAVRTNGSAQLYFGTPTHYSVANGNPENRQRHIDRRKRHTIRQRRGQPCKRETDYIIHFNTYYLLNYYYLFRSAQIAKYLATIESCAVPTHCAHSLHRKEGKL